MPPHLIGHLVDRKQRIDKCLPNSNFHIIRETIWMLRYEAWDRHDSSGVALNPTAILLVEWLKHTCKLQVLTLS